MMKSEESFSDSKEIVASLKTKFPNYEGQVEQVEHIPERSAITTDPDQVLRRELANPFSEAFGELYSHQAEALKYTADRENVAVATSTSSGKTYIYALQFARRFLESTATGLFVYPTKALARDQERELTEFYQKIGLNIDIRVYDGDTPSSERRNIRESADIILTNFVGLNVYMGYHEKWHAFLEELELLAIDEAHTYTGVHGMHVAWTMRRFKRLLDGYDTDPQIVTTSATIGNPREHSERVTGEEFVVVNDDGSPRGARDLVFWKPPTNEEALEEDAGFADYRNAQRNPVREASNLVAHLGLHGHQTLMFTRSRKTAELGSMYAEQAASSHPESGYLEIDPYHAGLGKERRRSIESKLKFQEIDGVTSTNALELGIDIGSIEATVLTGYPGTRQSFWQQLGRAGREETESLSVLVAQSDAMDQYIIDNPDYLLEDAVEDAVIGLENDAVYAQHLLCAADERPLTGRDEEWFGEQRLEDAIEMWTAAGLLSGDLKRGVRYTGHPRPQADVSMYGSSGTEFKVISDDGDIDMEPIARERAYRDHHEGALFLHDGVQYVVTELNENAPHPFIRVKESGRNEYTQTSSSKSIHSLETRRSRSLGNGYRVCEGTGVVEIHYSHYQQRDIQTGQSVSPLQSTGLEPIELYTDLMWVELPEVLAEDVMNKHGSESNNESLDAEVAEVFGGGLHGAEHAMIKLTPLELKLDKSDIGGLSTPQHSETGVPTWFIHDGIDGGLGFSTRIYEKAESVMENTVQRVRNCDCAGSNGCPACIMDSQCGNQNEFLHRPATVTVLESVLEQCSDK